MGDFWGLLTFLISLILVLWVGAEMLASVLPAGLTRFFRRALNFTLNFFDFIGEAAIGLVMTLIRGRPQQPPVSTVSQQRTPALMSRYDDTDDDPQTDRGLSGLSAADPAPAAPDPAQVWIESLDIGSRRRAVAVLVRDGWGTGKIRNALVGDNGEIGREIAEAKRQMGLADDEPPARQTPLAGRELADGVQFRG